MARTAMLRSASRHYRRSALLAERAAKEALRFGADDAVALAKVLITHQLVQARMSEQAVGSMLAEQGLDIAPAGSLAPMAFTTDFRMFEAMLVNAVDVPRLVGSLVQDAGRAAESVASTARPKVGHVRHLSPPSCSRCAVLAGRVYRWSDGFQRHPGCDCVMVPSTQEAAAGLVTDPTEFVAAGKITGLSKADLRAVADGADLGKIVNVRRQAAGIKESGRVLARAAKPTPEGIYRLASSQDDAVVMLRRFGYIT